ncbi:unnamed protein product [Lactuca saligna]|uniref:Uncharacterized protein n=1 Tax=Lactuca saligna TaxID=75948 RepID=A0AA35ZNP3_LACSI|nr:unnamed protein product [Lactuca saligna]
MSPIVCIIEKNQHVMKDKLIHRLIRGNITTKLVHVSIIVAFLPLILVISPFFVIFASLRRRGKEAAIDVEKLQRPEESVLTFLRPMEIDNLSESNPGFKMVVIDVESSSRTYNQV